MLGKDADDLRQPLVLGHAAAAAAGARPGRQRAVRGVVRAPADAMQARAVAAGERERELSGDEVGAGLHRLHPQRPAEGRQVVLGRQRARPWRQKLAEQRRSLLLAAAFAAALAAAAATASMAAVCAVAAAVAGGNAAVLPNGLPAAGAALLHACNKEEFEQLAPRAHLGDVEKVF